MYPCKSAANVFAIAAKMSGSYTISVLLNRSFCMRRVLFIALICLIALLPLSAANPADEALYGFTSATSRAD